MSYLRIRAISRRLAVPAALLAAIGCASAPPAPEQAARVRLEPIPVDSGASLPSLAISQIVEGGRPVQRVSFTAANEDLRLVIREIAVGFGLSYQIDPEVRGLVSTRLEGATLEETLKAIVEPHGFTYQVQGGVLRVGGGAVQTRTFTLDYVALFRVGATTTVVQRRLGSTGGGGVGNGVVTGGGGVGNGVVTGAGGGSSGADFINTTTVADLWEEIRIGLEALVFEPDAVRSDTAPPPPAAVTGATNIAGQANLGQQGFGGGGARAYSRVGGGRRLIITPISGQITVSAPPAKLAEVAAFISSFEASVQRQVQIEAKIVEVRLSKRYQFGIDWSVVGRRFGLAFGQAGGVISSNTVSATLGGGASQITMLLRALDDQGDVTVLSSPMVAALNNQPAIFDVTTDEVFFTVTRQPLLDNNGRVVSFNTQISQQLVNVGIVLDVMPQIGADNTITMRIRPLISSVIDVAEIDAGDGAKASAPIIAKRQTDTMARVRGGETIVIGGLMETRRDRSTSGIPGLRNLPLVGRFFTGVSRTDEKNELVIFLTPTVIVGASPVAQTNP